MALELRCADVGVACNGAIKADTKEELLDKVAEHVTKKHDVTLNETLIDYALTKVRTTGK